MSLFFVIILKLQHYMKHLLGSLRYKILLIAVSVLLTSVQTVFAVEYAGESQLASGRWVKIKVDRNGAFQLTRSMLKGWGFTDISKVNVYGYGGAMISERMGEGYIDDLPKLPVYRDAEKIIFYAQGPVSWRDTGSSSLRMLRTINPYSTAGYYFVSDKDVDADEMETTANAATSNDAPLITSFVDYAYHEQELMAPANTGSSLLGEDFKYNTRQTFTFDLPGRVEGTEGRVRINFAAKVIGGHSTVTVFDDQRQANAMTIEKVASDNYAICNVKYVDAGITQPGEKVNISVDYANTGILYMANLDYIIVNYFRKLQMNSSWLNFRSFSTSCRDSVFSVASAKSDLVIWDVTTKYRPKKVDFNIDGGTAYFRQTESGKREYLAFTPSSTFPAPEYVGVVSNQNLHGAETPTMVIITPKEFAAQAERVAELHRTVDGFKVIVVDDRSVYNEFSSGTPDAMAYRKLAKMFWERTKTLPEQSVDRFRYILLFGRCVYDNRRLTPETRGLNYPMLLTWESDNIASQSSSFNSDDVFCVLEDNTDVSTRAGKLNVAIGRMPVKSVDEARTAVDKLVKYVTTPDPGSWKNNIMLIADDGDNGIHMVSSDSLLVRMQRNGGERFVYNRVYIDAYNVSTDGSGHTYPEAREKMLRTFKNGTLFSSYIGHANPKAWTHNGLLSWSDINNEFYYKHPTFIYTGTCEFTRWDAAEVSGGELIYLNEQGGFIGMLTSSRATGISYNGEFAADLGYYISRPNADGSYPAIGDIIVTTKNGRPSDGGHRWKYALIGDPAMKLKYPQNRVVIDKINGNSVLDDANPPQIMACQQVSVEGHIEDPNGNAINDMNGYVFATIYDAQESVTTHGNGESDSDPGMEFTFDQWSNLLYDGINRVENGKFKFSLRVPSEIQNNYRPGLLSCYAYSVETTSQDANGLTSNFYVYDCDTEEQTDTIGPDITHMALNSYDFVDGDRVNESPYLLAKFTDPSGINLSTAGVGHQMSLLLDGKTTITNLEPFYSEDTERVGTLSYPLSELSDGDHTLRLRVWDTLGNHAERQIAFTVVRGTAPDIYRLYTDASPAHSIANFYLQHNRPDANLTVTLSVYNMMGQAVWSNTSTRRSDMFTSMPISWNLTDGSGRRVNRGIYFVRATVSTDGSSEASKTIRIAVAGE